MAEKDEYFLCIDYLLKYGIKTIATVVDVEYLCIEQEELEGRGIKNLNHSECVFASHRQPAFIVRYDFSINHEGKIIQVKSELTINVNQNLWLKAGDPLPILYINLSDIDYIPENEQVFARQKYVYSLPFPFPEQQGRLVISHAYL